MERRQYFGDTIKSCGRKNYKPSFSNFIEYLYHNAGINRKLFITILLDILSTGHKPYDLDKRRDDLTYLEILPDNTTQESVFNLNYCIDGILFNSSSPLKRILMTDTFLEYEACIHKLDEVPEFRTFDLVNITQLVSLTDLYISF